MIFNKSVRTHLTKLIKDYSIVSNKKREAIAEELGISNAGLGMILSGKRRISVEFIEKVCDICETDVYCFFKDLPQ